MLKYYESIEKIMFLGKVLDLMRVLDLPLGKEIFYTVLIYIEFR